MFEKRIQGYQKLFDMEWKTLIVMGGVWVWKTHLVRNNTPWDLDFSISDNRFKEELNSWILQLPPPDIFWESMYKYSLVSLSRKKIVLYDDLGSANITDAYLQKMKYWLDERIERQEKNKEMRTIFTTNLTLEDIKKMDERIASRIMLDWIFLTVSGEDLRKKTTRQVTI